MSRRKRVTSRKPASKSSDKSKHTDFKRKDFKHKACKPKASKSKAYKSKDSISYVRIIGGRFKRQRIPFINLEGLRPTPDRLRETLFNWIQFDLTEANVLDLCAGSGVLGLEALSRGASHATFIELQNNQAALLRDTISNLRLTESRARVITGNALDVIPTIATNTVMTSPPAQTLNKTDSSDNQHATLCQASLSTTNRSVTHFHLVFVDPPYDLDLWVLMIEGLITQGLTNTSTLFYIESNLPIPETLQHLSYPYHVIKATKIGQIYANLITISSL